MVTPKIAQDRDATLRAMKQAEKGWPEGDQ
jgi:hypothetical protein